MTPAGTATIVEMGTARSPAVVSAMPQVGAPLALPLASRRSGSSPSTVASAAPTAATAGRLSGVECFRCALRGCVGCGHLDKLDEPWLRPAGKGTFRASAGRQGCGGLDKAADKDRAWLIEQVVRLSMDNHALEEADCRHVAEAKARARQERHDRVAAMRFDLGAPEAFLAEHPSVTRESLVADGRLRPEAPAKGTALITSNHRTESGDALLTGAKDVLLSCSSATSRSAATSTADHRSS